ncbi:DUF3081 domain-containing protein [Aliidiomarina taiwanensis]|uniref:DUF3081 domain-containing protein n=1 Tax=Aliidiomarina taiwanensis TaxID=946228 RepID=A0A432WW70_9GAMM|nr:DUF3081 family protein [Aliidiomarina taiwanensis]RUO37987.1 DUF3081 domain-containing protein [Aliidiomarina taiwanensis]
MQDQIDTRLMLQAYEKITTHGEEVPGDIDKMHRLEGVTAFSDFDGYTLYLQDAEVKLQTGFHNTYKLDYDTNRALDNFIRKLKHIVSSYD